MVLSIIVLNRLRKLPIIWSSTGSGPRGVNDFLRKNEPSPSKSRNVSNSTAGAISPINSTTRGGVSLWLCVPGTRNTRAESDVTAGSARSPCSVQSSFSRSATGTHVSRETGSANAQYTCMPRPELTSVGFGNLSSLQKARRPVSAADCVS